jgi:hypothetical protein
MIMGTFGKVKGSSERPNSPLIKFCGRLMQPMLYPYCAEPMEPRAAQTRSGAVTRPLAEEEGEEEEEPSFRRRPSLADMVSLVVMTGMDSERESRGSTPPGPDDAPLSAASAEGRWRKCMRRAGAGKERERESKGRARDARDVSLLETRTPREFVGGARPPPRR